MTGASYDAGAPVALVTGGGSGLGRATSLRLAADGHRVVVADLHEAAAAAVAAEVEAAGGVAVPVVADVAVAADCERMVAVATEAFAPPDVLVANAGITGEGRGGDLAEASWDRVIAVNLTGAWLSTRAVLPAMVERGSGAVVLVGSIGGLVGVPNICAYAAAKGGVVAMTRQLASDYSPLGVRVNCVCPGTVDTPLVREAYRQRAVDEPDPEAAAAAAIAARASAYPARRLGVPDDVAGLVSYLAGPDAAWMTGAVLPIDGGYTAV